MKLAEKKLGYLRIVTPKYPDDGREAGRFVVADGAVVDGAAAAVSKARHSYAAAFRAIMFSDSGFFVAAAAIGLKAVLTQKA